ncbi:hypothetical protein ACFS7Z_13725 [Pontibacter toksunensis]|uniref:Uncharacterized protein n=1 Tax=Pontibacter toksunensis TaxID=1332631 RepID=A0ABW6BV60_9BACT
MKPLLQNVLKGWKSTIIGFILFACIILSVFQVDAVTWADAILPLMVSLMLIFAPRDFRKALVKFITSRAGIILWLIGFTALLIGCKTQKEQPQQPPAQVHKVWTQATVTNAIGADSAAVTVDFEQMELEREYNAQQGRATATVSKDAKGAVTGKCDCEGKTQTDTLKLYTRTEVPVPYPVRDPKYENSRDAAEVGPVWWMLRNIITPFCLLALGIVGLFLIVILLKHLLQNLFSPARKTASEQ